MSKLKYSLLFSAISLLICTAMLASTTFAWLHDTASANVRIEAGNLAITVIGYEADGTPIGSFRDAATPPVIEEENWEPGLTDAKHIRIENSGSLDLNYELKFVVEDEGLEEVLWYALNVVEDMSGSQITPVRESMTGLAADVKSGTLAPSEAVIYRIDYGMLESAGNTYMGRDFLADIVVTATQTDAEQN